MTKITNKIIFMKLLYAYSAFILLIILSEFYQSYRIDNTPSQPIIHFYTDAKIQLTYKDNTMDTADILIYETDQSINLYDGDLKYWRADLKSGNAGRITLASYVKKYKIISGERKKMP